jgi:spermidine synthase
MAAVSVVEDADGVARLRINNRQQEGSSSTLLRAISYLQKL